MKKSDWSNPWFFIPALLFLNTGLALLLLVPHGEEILYFNTSRTEPWNTIFRFFTRLGEPFTFGLVAALLLVLRRYRFALLIALAGLIISPLSFFLKDKIGKDRPITYFEKRGLRETVALVPEVDLNGGQTSFPSGHTMAAFGIYGSIALSSRTQRGKRWGLLCAGVAILVGFSRIFLVQHFLVDVVAGAFIGILVAWVVWKMDDRFFQRWKGLDRNLLQSVR
jgi:membrane-associated phospholipid phosphatase